jgi:polygalacturonase
MSITLPLQGNVTVCIIFLPTDLSNVLESTGNSDGANTIYSSHITFNNWTVDNGDDSLSLKANSTDITITNCNFYHGLGIAIGSIGQYKGAFETVQRAHAKNNVFYKTTHAAYFKTWTGEQVNYPPNGGGGGLGCKFLLLLTLT